MLALVVVAWRRRALAPPVAETPAEAKPEPVVEREPDAIYQKNRLVARVLEPQVDEAARQVSFAEVYNSGHLVLADECEWQKFIILVKKIGHASKMEPGALDKGRVLRGVEAQILGYREQ